MKELVSFPSGQVDYIFDSSTVELQQTYKERDIVFISDNTISALYPRLFSNVKNIIIPSGEAGKTLDTLQYILQELIKLEVTRKSLLIGIGGGVITDITGFAASVYMRGIAFGFMPTTLLGMVDAAIGGKNGVNIGLHKNMTGTITQPEFILYDISFLETLPQEEWSNGFAEIIKYACIFDDALFAELEKHDINYYISNKPALQKIITTCVNWKNKTVITDEHEKGIRKLLNFGHTAAHAIENLYEIPHGKAVAIGMVIAATLSEQINDLSADITRRLRIILAQYNLPDTCNYDTKKVMELLKMDKKRTGNTIDYILLERIGHATIQPLPFDTLETALTSCAQ